MIIHYLIKRLICFVLDHRWRKGKFGFTTKGTYAMSWNCDRCKKLMVKEALPGEPLSQDDGIEGL